jgi:hypothetical protein
MEDPKSRPIFRGLRFLNAQNVVALCNRPKKGGAELRIFHLYPTGPAMLTLEKKLPSHIKQAGTMDVCALDADKDGNQQFVIAVTSIDISIEVYTANYNARTATFSNLRSYITLRDVHQHGITKLCFSPFHSPTQNPEMRKDRGKVYIAGPQYIRLASVSYGNTVVVETFPLQPLQPDKLRESRYVLSHPSDEKWAKYAYLFIISLVVVVVAFMVQSFRTGFSDDVGLFKFLPEPWREFLDMPAGAAYGKQYVKITPGLEPTATGRLQNLMDYHDIPVPASPSTPSDSSDFPDSSDSPDSSDPSDDAAKKEKEKTLLLRPGPEKLGGVTVDVHPDKAALLEKDEEAKHWHELQEHEQSWWKERLKGAGQWAEAEGEGVLQGILFSEFAGAVAAGVGDLFQQ